MATRLYISRDLMPNISPAFGSQWDVTAAATAYQLNRAKANTSLSTETAANYNEVLTTVHNQLHMQTVSPRLLGQTIAGTFSAVIASAESATGANASLQIVIRLVDGVTGTNKAVLYAGHSTANNATVGALGEEFPTTRASRIMNGISLSSQTADAGDRLVVEWGARFDNTAATSWNANFNRGDPTATGDYALTSGLASGSVPWVELSQDLLFPAPATAIAVSDWSAGTKMGASSPVEGVATSDRPSGLKSRSATATDQTSLIDRPQGGRSPVRPTADSAAASDRPAGLKSRSGATGTSTGLGEVIVRAAQGPSAATGSSASASGRPIGTKGAEKVASEATSSADRPLGLKSPARPVAELASAIGRPIGTKSASRASAESALANDRPLGTKRVALTGLEQTSLWSAAAGRKIGAAATRSDARPNTYAAFSILFRDITFTVNLITHGADLLQDSRSASLLGTGVQARVQPGMAATLVERVRVGQPEV